MASRKRVAKNNSTRFRRSTDRICSTFEQMNNMRRDSLFCDVTLIAENIEIPAHKMILSASSPFFNSMFCTNFVERTQDKIKLRDVNADTLLLLIEYIYTCEVEITEENAQDLFVAANFLQLTDVCEACSEFLEEQLNPRNYLATRTFADIHGCLTLVNSADSYVHQHFREVVECEEFLTWPYEDVLRCISSDLLNVPSEQIVFECVITWVKYDLKTRKELLPALLKHIRLPFFSQKYLLKTVLKEPLLEDDTGCTGFVTETRAFHMSKGDLKCCTRAEITKPRRFPGLPKILLVAGGYPPTNTVECYCFQEERWYIAADMPIARYEASAAVLNGKVYVMGGLDDGPRHGRVDMYDITTDQWSRGVDMTTGRGGFGVAVLNNRIYAIGGLSQSNQYLDTAEVFNPYTQEWSAIAPMSVKRYGVGVGVLNNLIYAVGGNGNTAECYDPESNTWTNIAEMSSPRFGVSIDVLEGKLYAIGGYNRQYMKSVEVYDPTTNTWSPVPDMNYQRQWAGVATLNNLLYVVGGCDGASGSGSIEFYDPRWNRWTMIPHLMEFWRHASGVALIDKPT